MRNGGHPRGDGDGLRLAEDPVSPSDGRVRPDEGPALAGEGLASPGVEAMAPERSARSWRAFFESLGLDMGLALQWGRRGRPVTSALIPQVLRRRLLRWGGVELHDSVDGLERCWFQSPQVSIGSGCYIGVECAFEGRGRIEIAENCLLGPQVMLVTSAHDIRPDGSVSRVQRYRDVRIGAGCWLGARAMVMPGVTIGEGSVIAAGAVVTHDCEPGGVYGGVPARRIR